MYAKSALMLFSVIIPTFNRNDLLRQCLDRLLPENQSLDAAQYEIIVTDDTAEAKAEVFCQEHFPNVIYTQGPQKGPAANRNHGASLAKGEWLVFTDDDCMPDSGFLFQYRKAIIDNPDSKAFEGAILPDDWQLLKKDLAECPVNDKGGCFWSANIMVEKLLFNEIGGFDEQFRIAAQEDQDLKWQVLKRTNIVFIKQSMVIHPVRFKSLFYSLGQIPLRTENFVYYGKKHLSTLGFKNYKSLIWQLGLKSQAISFVENIKRGYFKTALVRFCNFIFYIPKLFTTH